MPISSSSLSRSRSKTFYTSSRPFDADVARMFECSRRYYLERGGEEWGRVVALQRVAHAFTSAHPPGLPLAQPLVLPPPLPAPGARTLESMGYRASPFAPGTTCTSARRRRTR
ncbi:hypothetical protein B0H17DRAFT_192314 [Mycena rosella]|uniref:Uncharacterized protein n=1 Tax=Mycena rosella TaxID=1033263 RepID=A0AAD7D072_MYCRO|nr:hypothetical protein B0H17DRAFT_192314 [Mycena rosella]